MLFVRDWGNMTSQYSKEAFVRWEEQDDILTEKGWVLDDYSLAIADRSAAIIARYHQSNSAGH